MRQHVAGLLLLCCLFFRIGRRKRQQSGNVLLLGISQSSMKARITAGAVRVLQEAGAL